MPYRSRGRPAGMRVPAEAFFDFKKADNWHLNIDQIPPAAGVLARRRLSVMVLRNPHPDSTRFSAALSMIEIFDLGEPSRQSGNCPILIALLIEFAAGALDCSAVGLSPRPEHV